MGCINVRVTPMGSAQRNEGQNSMSTASQLKIIEYVPEQSRQSSPEPIVVFRNKIPVVSNESGISTAYSPPLLKSPSSGHHQTTDNRRNLVELDDQISINKTIIGPASVKSQGSSTNGANALPSLSWDSNISDISEDSSLNVVSSESEELYETYGPATTYSVDPESRKPNHIINRFFLGKSNRIDRLSESDISHSVRHSNASKRSADSEGSIAYQPKYRRVIPNRPKNYVKGKIYDSSDESVEPELEDVGTGPSFEFHEVELMRTKLETALRSVSTKLSNLHDHHQKAIISETTSEAEEL